MSISFDGHDIGRGVAPAQSRGDGEGRAPARETQKGGATERHADLVRMIETEIVPRLYLAHQAHAAPRRSESQGEAPRPFADVAALARLALRGDAGPLRDMVRRALDAGMSLEELYLRFLAPTARLLGTWWEEDRCSFTDVTLGLGQLQRLVHEFGGPPERAGAHPPRNAILSPVPGEQHTFGLTLLGEFFRNAGWTTVFDPAPSVDSILETVGSQACNVAAFSLSRAELLDDLRDLIRAARRVSCRPNLAVLVGGRIFAENPHRAADVGADGTATTARDAVALAERLAERTQPVHDEI